MAQSEFDLGKLRKPEEGSQFSQGAARVLGMTRRHSGTSAIDVRADIYFGEISTVNVEVRGVVTVWQGTGLMGSVVLFGKALAFKPTVGDSATGQGTHRIEGIARLH